MTSLLALAALVLLLLLSAAIRGDGYGHRPPPRSHDSDQPAWRRWS